MKNILVNHNIKIKLKLIFFHLFNLIVGFLSARKGLRGMYHGYQAFKNYAGYGNCFFCLTGCGG